MDPMLSLALVGAVPISPQEQERSRLLRVVPQLLKCELVRRVLHHWHPTPPPEVADVGTSVTEVELARAARQRRHGPPPDLVTSHLPRSDGGDLHGSPQVENISREQLQTRLDRIQAVRSMAQRMDLDSDRDLAERSAAPAETPQALGSPARLSSSSTDEPEDGEEEEEEEEERQKRAETTVAGELMDIAAALDLGVTSGPLNANTPSQTPAVTTTSVTLPLPTLAASLCLGAALGVTVQRLL